MIFPVINLIELDDGTIYRKPIYLMVKTMVFCRFSLKPIHKPHETSHSSAFCRRRRQRRRHPNTWAQRSCRAHLATRKQWRLQSNKWEIIGIYHIIWGYVCQCIYTAFVYIYMVLFMMIYWLIVVCWCWIKGNLWTWEIYQLDLS